MSPARCEWCAGLGGSVTAAGDVSEWAATVLADALAQRIEGQGGGTAYLQAGDGLRYIGMRLCPDHRGDGDASADLAAWLLGPVDHWEGAAFGPARGRALLRSLLPLLPYPVLLAAVNAALARCHFAGVK